MLAGDSYRRLGKLDLEEEQESSSGVRREQKERGEVAKGQESFKSA